MIPLDEVKLVGVCVNAPGVGAVTADSAPTYKVFEETTDTEILSGSMTERTGETGKYRAQYTVSAANGFEVGKFYQETVEAIVDAVTYIKTTTVFRVVAAEAVAGFPKGDAQYVGGTTQTGGDLATLITAVDDFVDTEVAATLAAVDTEMAAVKAKTDQLTFTVANKVDGNVGAVNGSTTGVDKLSAHLPSVLILVVGSGSTTTAVKFSTVNGAGPSAVDDFYNGAVIVFTSGALAGQRTSITDYVGSTTTATVVATTSAPANAVTGVIV